MIRAVTANRTDGITVIRVVTVNSTDGITVSKTVTVDRTDGVTVIRAVTVDRTNGVTASRTDRLTVERSDGFVLDRTDRITMGRLRQFGADTTYAFISCSFHFSGLDSFTMDRAGRLASDRTDRNCSHLSFISARSCPAVKLVRKSYNGKLKIIRVTDSVALQN